MVTRKSGAAKREHHLSFTFRLAITAPYSHSRAIAGPRRPTRNAARSGLRGSPISRPGSARAAAALCSRRWHSAPVQESGRRRAGYHRLFAHRAAARLRQRGPQHCRASPSGAQHGRLDSTGGGAGRHEEDDLYDRADLLLPCDGGGLLRALSDAREPAIGVSQAARARSNFRPARERKEAIEKQRVSRARRRLYSAASTVCA
jgi:hypothetical protein